VNTVPANFANWIAALQQAIQDTGVPCAISAKPQTAPGQPWVSLSLLSALHDGDIAYFDTDQDALIQVRSVGYSPEQVSQVYWRVDAAVTGLEEFEGGRVIQRWRDNLSGLTRDDRTFPNQTVYDVAATYRLWLAPTELS
jgi:hypothetical protein